jgi:hypothetical protein
MNCKDLAEWHNELSKPEQERIVNEMLAGPISRDENGLITKISIEFRRFESIWFMVSVSEAQEFYQNRLEHYIQMSLLWFGN